MAVKSRYPKGQVALERAFSKLGLGSRSQAREWILDGKVRVDGRVVRDPARGVVPEKARIELEGQTVRRETSCTIAFHKPRGVVTTLRDERGRATVFSILREPPARGLMPVGRLDQHTSGLLLFTNDSRFSEWVLNPENRVPRVYLVEVKGEATPERIKRLEGGFVEDGQRYSAESVQLLKVSGRESRLRIELREGKNREVRRLCQGAGLAVVKLKRVSFGGIELGTLALGKWRLLSSEELRSAFPGCPVRLQG